MNIIHSWDVSKESALECYINPYSESVLCPIGTSFDKQNKKNSRMVNQKARNVTKKLQQNWPCFLKCNLDGRRLVL